MNSIEIVLYLVIFLLFVIGMLQAWTIHQMQTSKDNVATVVEESLIDVEEVLNQLGKWMQGFAQTIEARITKGAKAKVQSTIEEVAKNAVGGWIDKNLGGLLGSFLPGAKDEKPE